MSICKINEKCSNLTTNNSKTSRLTKNENNYQKKSSAYFYTIYQSKYQEKSFISNTNLKQTVNEFKEQSIQCTIIEYRLNLNICSQIKISRNAVFLPFQIKRFNRESKEYNENNKKSLSSKKSDKSLLKLREIGLQTYTDRINDVKILTKTYFLYDLDNSNKAKVEKTIEDLIYTTHMKTSNLNNNKLLVSKFIKIIDQMSEESIFYLNKYLNDSGSKFITYVESLIKLNQEKLKIFDSLLLKLINEYNLANIRSVDYLQVPELSSDLVKKTSNNTINFKDNDIYSIDLIKLIKLAEIKRKGVRFETSEEKRRQAVEKFKKAVRLVIINREWFKNLNSDKKEERETLLLECNKFESSAEFLTSKKLQLIFNKEEFRAQKNLTAIITDTHRRILAKDPNSRTSDQIEILLNLINSIPRLSTFPKHVCNHIAKIIKLLVYEKGREIVREGHVSIGFYFIINGSCDVLSMGNNGLLKIDELQSCDTFGDTSFQNGYTPYTVITNQRTEMLVVEPNEIEAYLNKLRVLERKEIKDFITNYWIFLYWNWRDEEFEKFCENSEFLRFNIGDLIHDNSIKQIEKIYFIQKGKVELIRLVNLKKKNFNKKISSSTFSTIKNNDEILKKETNLINKKLFRVCLLEKYNYFGFESSQNINCWFRAYDDEVNIIRISKENFLSIHKHSRFLLSQLSEDYKLTIPSDLDLFVSNQIKIKKN